MFVYRQTPRQSYDASFRSAVYRAQWVNVQTCKDNDEK